MTAQTVSFVYRVFIGKPAAEVWRSLTEKTLVDQYYLVPLRKLELQSGGKIAYGREDEQVFGIVKEAEAPVNLVHTFRFAGLDEPESLVSYEIEAVGEAMCSLTITHSELCAEGETYARISGGWPVIASSLKTLLETGDRLPWPRS